MYVRPHLDFCDVIFHTPKVLNSFDSSIHLNYLMNSIERIQYQAALAIICAWKGTNLNKIYEELGWESLTDRWSRRLIHFYKIQNNYTPHYLKSPIPPLRTHLYGIRSGNVLREITCRTNHIRDIFQRTCQYLCSSDKCPSNLSKAVSPVDVVSDMTLHEPKNGIGLTLERSIKEWELASSENAFISCKERFTGGPDHSEYISELDCGESVVR